MENLSHHLWIGFAGGILASAHCLGMCGGFVLHLSRRGDGKKVLVGHLLWLAGKSVSYLFLGAVAGYAGGVLGTLLANWGHFQNLLSYLAGGLILLMGANLLGWLPARGASRDGIGSLLLATLGRNFLATPSNGAALTLGLVTGLLPCPIVLSFLAYSIQSGSVTVGMVSLGALSLGTMAPLLLLGAASRLSGLHLRSWAPKAGGIILILLGLATLLRGTELHHRLLGCPSPPSLAKSATGAAPCCTQGKHGNLSGN